MAVAPFAVAAVYVLRLLLADRANERARRVLAESARRWTSAHHLDLDVTLEGVETEAGWRLLQRMDRPPALAQGFYLGASGRRRPRRPARGGRAPKRGTDSR